MGHSQTVLSQIIIYIGPNTDLTIFGGKGDKVPILNLKSLGRIRMNIQERFLPVGSVR